MVPVSCGENISTPSASVAQEPFAIHFKFFPVHILSTEIRRLSARRNGYPPPYAQLLHRSLEVTQRIPAMTAHRNHSVFSRRPSVNPEFPPAPPCPPNPRPAQPSPRPSPSATPAPSATRTTSTTCPLARPRPSPAATPSPPHRQPCRTESRAAPRPATPRTRTRRYPGAGAWATASEHRHRHRRMPRKCNCPVSGIGLPWIYDLSPGAEATRIHESGAAAFGCPGRRSGCLVSASRHSPAAAQEKAPPGRFSFTSGRIDRPGKPLVQAG